MVFFVNGAIRNAPMAFGFGHLRWEGPRTLTLAPFVQEPPRRGEAFLFTRLLRLSGEHWAPSAPVEGRMRTERGEPMKDFRESTYGDRIAEVYDEIHGSLSSPEQVDPMVDVLEELAAGHRALELGIGTGRIALPLAARGIDVHGIDASESIVAKMRRKPGGADIPVTLGDFAEVDADGRFSLVYVVFNTFFGLLTQEAQVRWLRERRAPSGRRRRLPDRGVRAGSDSVRRRSERSDGRLGDRPRIHRRVPPRSRRTDRGVVASVHHRERDTPLPGQAALRLAVGAGPDGEAGRDGASTPVERLAAHAVHGIQHQPRLGIRATLRLPESLSTGTSWQPYP